ncbi:unnamed protein product [Pleuronectes platessa]|uniref:Uncharacterized protein n=1 Tax=Pleuronectes platessa TaxID=8262 RepID=A0A9N7YSL9_PLEPL|nr:unnamed protein product [Pleuronectes platessa]
MLWPKNSQPPHSSQQHRRSEDTGAASQAFKNYLAAVGICLPRPEFYHGCLPSLRGSASHAVYRCQDHGLVNVDFHENTFDNRPWTR